MLPNLNKESSNKIRVVITDDYRFTSSGLEKKMFSKKLIKELSKQNGDAFFHEGIPLSMAVEIRTTARGTIAEKENRFTTSSPNIGPVLTTLIETLGGAAYAKVTQIAEVSMARVFGNENRIIIEIERI